MMMAFETDKATGVATGYSSKFLKNPDYYSRNFLVGLGPHSTPLFLFKDILPQLREELVFQENFSRLATDMLQVKIFSFCLKKYLVYLLIFG